MCPLAHRTKDYAAQSVSTVPVLGDSGLRPDKHIHGGTSMQVPTIQRPLPVYFPNKYSARRYRLPRWTQIPVRKRTVSRPGGRKGRKELNS